MTRPEYPTVSPAVDAAASLLRSLDAGTIVDERRMADALRAVLEELTEERAASSAEGERAVQLLAEEHAKVEALTAELAAERAKRAEDARLVARAGEVPYAKACAERDEAVAVIRTAEKELVLCRHSTQDLDDCSQCKALVEIAAILAKHPEVK